MVKRPDTQPYAVALSDELSRRNANCFPRLPGL